MKEQYAKTIRARQPGRAFSIAALISPLAFAAGCRRCVFKLLPALCLAVALPACAVLSSDTPQPASPGSAAVTANAEPRLASEDDQDADGVINELDNCSDTLASRPVDEQGCELFSGTLENVQFAPDSHQLSEQSRQALDLLVKRMQAHPDVVLAISGHTDNRGNARDNLELSKKRVLSVVRYLVLNGVDGRRLLPHGYGESRPVFSNATPAGRSRNRRIEISLVPPD